MAKAKLAKQVFVTTENKTGMFAEVTSALAGTKVNLTGICAWSMEGKAYFALLTSDNAKAITTLSGKGFQAIEQEVVTVMLEDKIGAASGIAQKIKMAGLDLEYVYGTNCGCKDSSALLVIIAKENAKVVSCLNA